MPRIENRRRELGRRLRVVQPSGPALTTQDVRKAPFGPARTPGPALGSALYGRVGPGGCSCGFRDVHGGFRPPSGKVASPEELLFIESGLRRVFLSSSYVVGQGVPEQPHRPGVQAAGPGLG